MAGLADHRWAPSCAPRIRRALRPQALHLEDPAFLKTITLGGPAPAAAAPSDRSKCVADGLVEPLPPVSGRVPQQVMQPHRAFGLHENDPLRERGACHA